MLRSAKKELRPFYDEVSKAQEWLRDSPESTSKEMKAMETKLYFVTAERD